MIKRLTILFAAGLFSCMAIYGQRARYNNLFFHIDFAAGNIYTAALSSFATWGLNEATSSNIFENALEIPFYSGESVGMDMDVKNYDALGFTARDLFNTIHPSLKLGYVSSSLSDTNYGFYATAEYCSNQFKSQAPGAPSFSSNRMQRALFGGSAFMVFGGIGRKYHFMVEAGARYSMALGYKGGYGTDKNVLNDGVSSHFALKLTGPAALQDFGVYADINHFDLLKTATDKVNGWNIGIMWTVTPGQGNNRAGAYRYKPKGTYYIPL